MQCRSEAHLNDVGRSGTLRYGAAVRLKTWHDAGPGFAKGQRESSVEFVPLWISRGRVTKGVPYHPKAPAPMANSGPVAEVAEHLTFRLLQ